MYMSKCLYQMIIILVPPKTLIIDSSLKQYLLKCQGQFIKLIPSFNTHHFINSSYKYF